MRRAQFAAITIITATGLLQGCAALSTPTPDAQAALVAALTQQGDRWDKAIVRKDRAAIEANMAEDFRQINSQGSVGTKQSFVEGLVSADLVIDPYTVEEFDARLLK